MLFLAAVFELSCFPLWTSIYENDMRGEGRRRRRRRTNLKAGGGGDGGGGVGEQVVTLTEEMRVGVEGGEETKGRKSSSKKKKRKCGRWAGGRALWCVSISEWCENRKGCSVYQGKSSVCSIFISSDRLGAITPAASCRLLFHTIT